MVVSFQAQIELLNGAIHTHHNAWYQTPVNVQVFTITFTFQASRSPSPSDCGNGFETIANSSNPYPPGYNDRGSSSGSFSWGTGCDGNGNINAGNTGYEADLPPKGPREMSDLYVTRAF